VVLDPYAKSILSRRRYGALGPKELDYTDPNVLGLAQTWPQVGLACCHVGCCRHEGARVARVLVLVVVVGEEVWIGGGKGDRRGAVQQQLEVHRCWERGKSRPKPYPTP